MSRLNGHGNGAVAHQPKRSRIDPQARAVRAEIEARTARAKAEKAGWALREKGIKALSGAVALGGYDWAKTTRVRPGSATKNRAGAADFHRDHYTLQEGRKKCQAADRNDELVRGLLQSLIGMVQSDGFTLSVETKDEGWNGANEADFNAWAGEGAEGGSEESEDDGGAPVEETRVYDPGACDIRGLMCLDDMGAENIRVACIEGDLIYLKLESGKLQGVEGERLRNPGGGADTATMKGGIETDRYGRPVAYHIAEWGMTGSYADLGSSRRVPAEHVLFLANPLRNITGSTRGEPQLAASLQRLEDLAGFDEAARIAARIQSCLAAFIKRNDPAAAQQAFPGTTETRASGTSSDGSDERRAELEPGMIHWLQPNEDIQAVSPSQPGPQYDSFVLMQMLLVCMNLGLPLPVGILDPRMANLSTVRSILQVAWRNLTRWQAWQRRRFYTPVYLWRTAMRIRKGELPFRADWMRHSFTAPPAPVMDPKVEIEAGRMGIDARLIERSEVARRIFGTNVRRAWPRMKREEKQLRDDGIAPMAPAGTTGMPQDAEADAGGGGGPGAAAPGGGPPGGTPPKAKKAKGAA